MAFTLLVKPIALAAVALVLWALWRAADYIDPAAARRHRRAVALGALAIGLLLLKPSAWAALGERPGAVLAGAAVWAWPASSSGAMRG